MSSEQFATEPVGTPDHRPAISAPDALSPAALADARRAQPKRGLIGLAFVLPVAALLAAGAGGPAHSVVVLAPVVTFSLPVVAMIAFWWEDWPGSLLRGGWSGVYDTVVVVAAGLVLTDLGQRVAAGVVLWGPAAPGLGAAYPDTLPLAAGIFTIMLQLTLVNEGWPLRGLGRLRSGVAALAVCWVAGSVVFLGLVRPGVVSVESYGAWLTAVGVWQMVWYVVLRGWPFARIRRRPVRLAVANVVVVACGWGSHLLASELIGWSPGWITAVSGAGIASVLVVSMLFEAWPAIRFDPLPGRSLALVTVVLLTALLSWALPMLAQLTGVPAVEVSGWVTHATLNALSVAVILHVAVWRRWPAGASTSTSD
ncbi:hypothetical protein MOQ72_39650 [Saccharopolyspora sp. K220]|uniref:hypothetical protein n=1 Tax=Saccharopolyspora soli TaxID=2926618 RepID=UPI001F580044|nr:hypothetical protein [Saccharopolyspora soli]MCI2423540.1 hypothetical protein [Saccharopolyspora soli]